MIATGDGDTGFLRGSQQYKTQVVLRKFISVTYQEAETRQPLVPFFAALRLPFPDRPGLAWDPREGLSAEAALEKLKHHPAVAERETLTELVPAEPFIPQSASTRWHRAGTV